MDKSSQNFLEMSSKLSLDVCKGKQSCKKRPFVKSSLMSLLIHISSLRWRCLLWSWVLFLGSGFCNSNVCITIDTQPPIATFNAIDSIDD